MHGCRYMYMLRVLLLVIKLDLGRVLLFDKARPLFPSILGRIQRDGEERGHRPSEDAKRTLLTDPLRKKEEMRTLAPRYEIENIKRLTFILCSYRDGTRNDLRDGAHLRIHDHLQQNTGGDPSFKEGFGF